MTTACHEKKKAGRVSMRRGLTLAVTLLAATGARAQMSALEALKAQVPEVVREAITAQAPRAVSAAPVAGRDDDFLSIDNPSHRMTYGVLLALGQITTLDPSRKLFATAGTAKIEDLAFWRDDSDHLTSATKALRMAQRIDDTFRKATDVRRAGTHAPFDLAKALNAGKNTGMNIRALADVVAVLYDFSAYEAAVAN